MGLRCLLCLLALQALLLLLGSRAAAVAEASRPRRQASTTEGGAYRPPIALSAPAPAIALLKDSYRPPISLAGRPDEYRSPLLPPPPNPYPADAPRTYHSHPQTYVLQNQPPSQSVQYFPTGHQQQSFSVSQHHQPATSYSVHQAAAQPASFSQSTTAERTSSKVVASHVPAQAIHKAPASEIRPDQKGQSAKEKDKANDEYVVYYYYYYDNDTAANHANNANGANNLSLNFDDIPSLESYDVAEPPERSARIHAADANSLPSESGTNHPSQPRSVGDAYGRRPADDAPAPAALPPKPISNVFRYGSNEVPRFPVLPNFVATEAPTTVRPDAFSTPPDSLTTEPPATRPSNAQNPDLKTGDDADDDDARLNSVLDNASRPKPVAEKAEEDRTTTAASTTTTTATEPPPPTTTEEETTTTTTTTERPRRRPSLGGGNRRRFNPSPASSFSPSRTRQAAGARSSTPSTSSTSSTTTTPAPARRSFQGNRIRPRPSAGGNRPRAGSRTGADEDTGADRAPSSESPSTTAAARSRFTSAAPRRFQSSRSRTPSSTISTTSTTRAPSPAISRSRPTSGSRPRPNLISRNRPPRPGFLRPRPGSEPEEPETTTAAAVVAAPVTEQEAPPETSEDVSSSSTRHDEDSNETEEEDGEADSAEETEEPTTTEGSRFSALFRPRNRNLGNRPRPVIGNRPPRS